MHTLLAIGNKTETLPQDLQLKAIRAILTTSCVH